VEYFVILVASEEIRIEAHETYSRQSYRNRCIIEGPVGRQNLILPVIKPHGNHSKINEIALAGPPGTFKKVWRAIQTAYSLSPYYSYYEDILKGLVLSPLPLLLENNIKILHSLIHILDLKVNLYTTQQYDSHPSGLDFRNSLHPKKNSLIKQFPRYIQVFEEKQGFQKNLSILDLLFCLGPDSKKYLKGTKELNSFL